MSLKNMAILLFLALILGVLSSPNNENLKILGGIIAVEGQFPFMASIDNEYEAGICSGVIIDSRWILTVARCVMMGIEPFSVRVGTLDNENGVHTKYNISGVVHYPEGNPEYDIALLRTNVPIQITDLVQSIEFDFEPVGVNEVLTMVGYGYHLDGANLLRYLNVLSISNSQCEQLNKITDFQMCTMAAQEYGGCMKDEGSPIISNGKLVAILTYPGCGGPYDVHIRLSDENIQNWIKSVL